MNNKKKPTVKAPKTLAEIMAEVRGVEKNQNLSEHTKKEINQYIEQQLEVAVNSEVKKAATEIKESLRKSTKEVADESFEGIKNKIEKDRMNTIQATSIVTIFIGFLVVQFNILQFGKSIGDLAGLSLILLSSIIIFVLLLDLVIKLDLPYEKTKTLKGITDGISPLAGLLVTRTVKVPLSWKPSSWGEGLKIRAIATGFGLLLMAVGIMLVLL